MPKVDVVYATQAQQLWLETTVPDGTSVREAIERSGILTRCPEIDLEQQKVGIHAKFVKLDAVVEDGARIEIYRPIIADPETVLRRDTKVKSD
ncbi:MAG: RnfH family protein [Azospirillum sp.]|nr:RnfH family protein [Azospirillum sp.]